MICEGGCRNFQEQRQTKVNYNLEITGANKNDGHQENSYQMLALFTNLVRILSIKFLNGSFYHEID